MGTRHLTAVVKNGEYKVAQYGQWDGYPEGQGKDILNFLHNEFNREIFEQKVVKLNFITEEEIDELYDNNPNICEYYPELSRNTGSKILSLVQNADRELKMYNNLDFAADSLFCEYAYVIDLDKNTFEVYEGFNKSPLAPEERFAIIDYSPEHRENKYYPVKHVISFQLDNLPTLEQFFEVFKSEEETA